MTASAYYQRGYGWSSRPQGAGAYRLDLLAADVVAIAEALGHKITQTQREIKHLKKELAKFEAERTKYVSVCDLDFAVRCLTDIVLRTLHSSRSSTNISSATAIIRVRDCR